ncbi:hypothetical protein LZ554_009446 [Drepanopeziza brunnea f. sp. 'monogermtubi']|nr:hypothetical protein LZ554_009446 [Drepanopeziza brunnea f. sp. 'monogermtubi']
MATAQTHINDNMALGRYEYKPLPTDEIHIRLVLLHTVTEEQGQPMTCEIISHPLSQCPAYNAVSYVWGHSLDQGRVMCDGEFINIPSNLYQFLLLCRTKTIEKPFWIDSICIDQGNDEERGTQFAEMRNIYAQSSRTLVWLGKEADQSSIALNFIRTLSSTLSDLDPEAETRRSLWFRSRRYLALAVFSHNWSAFFKLRDRDWFRRAWIVQEIALTKNTWVHCGPSRIAWSELQRALLYIIQHQIWIFEFYVSPNLEILLALQHTQHETANGVKRVYWQVLARHRRALASDPREDIFAYYSLSSYESFKEHSILPNYLNGTRDLYIEVASNAMEMATNLDFLSIPKLRKNGGIDLKLPSWVPDWRASEEFCSSLLYFEALHFTEGGGLELPFSATNNSICRPTVHKELGQLELSGYIVDRLERISSHWEVQDTNGYQSLRKQAQVLQRNQAHVHEWASAVGVRFPPDAGCSTYPTGEPFEEALRQTLTGGLLATEKTDAIRPLYHRFRSR